MVGTRKKGNNEEKIQLRISAENFISRMPDLTPELVEKPLLELIHELRVHQIELEIQNEELKKAHVELEHSRDRYQNLYDLTPVGYFTLTEKALIAEVNLSGAALLGVVRLKLKNARFRRFIPPNQYDIWDRFFLSLLGRDEKQSCILLLKKSDGTLFDARIEGVRDETDEGVFQTRIIVQDISDQREAAEKIRVLAQIADEAPACIIVHDFDGKILYANEETFRLHGYTSEEFLAKNLHEIDIPEDKQDFDERLQKISDTGEAVFEASHSRKDGSLVPLHVHGKIISWAGERVLLSIATDLTEQKQVQKLRIESEERFHGIIRDIPDNILVHRNGTILFVNPAALSAMKYPAEEVIGSSLLEFVASESHPLIMAKMQERETGEEGAPFEITILTKAGEPRITEVRGTLIQYEGEPASLLMLSDITEWKKNDEAFKEAVQKLRLLTNLTRHDILNQLTAVRLLHDLALETEEMKEVREYIIRAQNAGNQIEATVGFTREYENFGAVSSGWHPISQFIDYVKSEVSPGTISIQNLIPPDLEIYADPIIRKIFTTLLENSIRHGGEVHNFRFSCGMMKDSLIIICEDDGVGIPSQDKERIFEDGYGKHTGLGLFLTREILSITGLFIRECGVPGEGGRFEIVVPTGKFRTKIPEQ